MYTIIISAIALLISVMVHPADADSLYRQGSTVHSTNLQSTSAFNQMSVFKPNEAISVQIIHDSTSIFNGIYKIDERGYVNMPIIGHLSITHLSVSQLVDTIKTRCIDYLPFPNIRITPLMRLSLLGGFYKPGLYWIDSRSSLWDAIQLAEGFQREDGLKLLRWERDGKIISKDLTSIFQSGVSLQSIGFKSGDQLCITARPKTELSFREHFVPFFTLFLSTLTTGLTIYSLTR
jgi:polysaccharide export outer membrane protein